MFGIYLRTVSYWRQYCSYVSNFLRFERTNKEWFLVFGVLNAKYLVFDTLDESALKIGLLGVRLFTLVINSNLKKKLLVSLDFYYFITFCFKFMQFQILKNFF